MASNINMQSKFKIVKTKLLFFKSMRLFPDEEFPKKMGFSIH